MRRTIFTLTHAALESVGLLWQAVEEADAAAYEAAASEDSPETLAMYLACDEFATAVLIETAVGTSEFARYEVGERLYNCLRAEEEVASDLIGAITWTLNAFYFHTGEGRRERGGLKESEFGIMAEG